MICSAKVSDYCICSHSRSEQITITFWVCLVKRNCQATPIWEDMLQRFFFHALKMNWLLRARVRETQSNTHLYMYNNNYMPTNLRTSTNYRQTHIHTNTDRHNRCLQYYRGKECSLLPCALYTTV